MRERRVTRPRAKSDGSQTLPRHRNPTCHDFQTSAATWIRFCLPARDEIPVDILTARNASTLFVLRTVQRQLLPTQVTDISQPNDWLPDRVLRAVAMQSRLC
ncbi:hypothetical protein [Burkholderia metallica]|uniref:hypothetical protein n=1 Tax=Burkholderia metallica TaxID=488729 RepID=UPI00131A7DA9|nr:hypothetical protein [Burkholderia metallica]